MSADERLSWLASGVIGYNSILEGDHLRTIPPKFSPNWLSSFRGEDFYTPHKQSLGGGYIGITLSVRPSFRG